MDLGLKDARVVIVGASRGIGRATAKCFASERAKLALIARNVEGLHKTADQCREAGSPEIITLSADMSSGEQIMSAFRHIGKAWNTVNVLINNAANSIGTHGSFEKFHDESAYIEAYNRIALGYVRTTRSVLPYMKAADWGRIVNVCSASTSNATPFLHIYNMTKSAVASMSRANARELAPFGISVNALSPGGIMVESGNWGTVMNGYFRECGLDPSDPHDAVKLGKIKMGAEQTAWMERYGLVDEYGKAITWLGSKANSFMTGANINVDGGSNF